MATTEAERGTLDVSEGDSLDELLETHSVVLVEFYAEWCGTCKRMQSHLESIAADTEATVLTVDIESNLEAAIEFGAQSTPTFVLFVDGRPIERLRGGQTETALRNLLEAHLR